MKDNPEAPKPLVIFYDCCVPKRQFKKTLGETVLFADHLFVREVFPEKECRSDRVLFSLVEALRLKEYRDRICLFVTQDRKDFLERVRGHPALNTTIKLLFIDHCNSVEFNWLRAREVAGKFVSALAEVLERKGRRKKIDRADIFAIFEKYFPTDKTA